ncbi:MAG: hypothetical protein ACREMP_03370 [Candidatus Tyrphobacter sp.]
MKMSVLGIRNGIRDAALRVGYDPRNGASQLGACRWIENAIEDWGNKYPHDSWLPTMTIALERIYARIDTAQSHAQARRMLAWIHRRYRGSHFERVALVVANLDRRRVHPSTHRRRTTP